MGLELSNKDEGEKKPPTVPSSIVLTSEKQCFLYTKASYAVDITVAYALWGKDFLGGVHDFHVELHAVGEFPEHFRETSQQVVLVLPHLVKDPEASSHQSLCHFCGVIDRERVVAFDGSFVDSLPLHCQSELLAMFSVLPVLLLALSSTVE